MTALGSRHLVALVWCILASGRMVVAQEKGPIVITAPAAAGTGGRNLALAIGVDTFRDPYWPKLRFTRADAEAMASELDTHGRFAATVLATEQVSRQQVLDALDQLRNKNTRSEDTVLIYVSTHGTLARELDGSLRQVLVLGDTDHKAPLATGLRLTDLIQRFEDLPSRRKVLVLATCYSGAGKSSLSNTVKTYMSGLKSAPLQPLYAVSNASVILSASAWGETAREDESLGHDIYTHFLMQALLGYDPNADGATSVTEAHDFARQRTYEFTQGRQRPTALLTIEGDDPVVLAGSRTSTGRPVLLAYESELDGYAVRVDGMEKGQLPGGIVVEPGWHDIELAKHNAEGDEFADWRGRVLVRLGERLPLARLLQAEPQRQITVRLGGTNSPKAKRGSSRPFMLTIDLQGRLRNWPVEWLSVSVLAKIGFGQDAWRINQQQFNVDLLNVQGRLGLGVVFDVGRFVLHFDAWGGTSYLRETPTASFYSGPIHRWSGLAGVSAQARLRLARHWSMGLTPGIYYSFGGLSGVAVETALVGTWSF